MRSGILAIQNCVTIAVGVRKTVNVVAGRSKGRKALETKIQGP